MNKKSSAAKQAVFTLNDFCTKLKRVIGKNDYIIAVLVTLTVIIVGGSIGWYNNKNVPPNPAPIAHYTSEPNNKLSYLSNWDGPDYISLARGGYTNVTQANFFPLYPLLIRIVNTIVPSFLLSALLVAWVSLSAAVYFYIKVIKVLFKIDKEDHISIINGLLLFLLFPTGIFLIATYTESLFAALALGSIYFALNKKFIPAAILTLFCTATHVTGVFVLALLALILWEQKEKLRNIVVAVVIGSLGLLSYMYYLHNKFGAPFAFITAQRSHGWLEQSGINGLTSSVDMFNIAFIILLLAAIVYWWNKRRSLAIYSFFFLCIPIVGQQFGGFNRYVLMAFPIPLMLYGLTKKNPLYFPIIIALMAIAWSYFALQYAGGYIGG